MNTLATLVRVGFAEAIAYRAELLVWLLATNMPLIMWLLWSTVAEEAPLGRFGPHEFAAYFLVTLVVRLLTSVWVGWQINDEARRGVLQQRLLRPFSVFGAYALENLGALPLRTVMLSPVVIFIAAYVPTREFSHDPLQILLAPLTVVGAWSVGFSSALVLGTVSLYWQSSMALFEMWQGAYFIFAGYLVPIELFPAWLQRFSAFLPFPYMLSLPVQTILGAISVTQTLQGLLIQAAFSAGFFALAFVMWRRGLRRYEAFGG